MAMRSLYLLPCLLSVVLGRGSLRSAYTDKNIVEIAQEYKNLSSFVTVLNAGHLAGALEGKGPFTVFAPSNEAFAKLSKAELEKLLDPKHMKSLDVLLEYHVVPGAVVHSKDLGPIQKLKTLEGQKLLVESTHGGVYINKKSKVTSADNDASNGALHIIDTILMPAKPKPPTPPNPPRKRKNIVQLAESNKDLSTLVTVLKLANLVTTLEGKGPFTVFAPSDEAFANVPNRTMAALLKKPAGLARGPELCCYPYTKHPEP